VATVWSTVRTVNYVVSVVLIVVIINSPRLFEYRMEIKQIPVTNCDLPETVTNATDTIELTSQHVYDEINTVVGGLEPVAMHTVKYDAVGGSDGLALYNDSTPGVHVTCNGSETVLQVREKKSALGESHSYQVVYKSLFVSIVLFLVPILTLILLSVFIIRALKQTQSYRMSMRQKQRTSVNERTTLQRTDGSIEQPLPHDDRVGRLEQIRRQSRSTVRRLKVKHN